MRWLKGICLGAVLLAGPARAAGPNLAGDWDGVLNAGEAQALARLAALIRSLKPPDDQVMLLYLEGLDAAAIGEITGLSAGAVATRIHRIKKILAARFGEAGDA